MDKLLNLALFDINAGGMDLTIPAVLIAIAVIFLVIIICTSYVKAPPNKAYIITG